MILEVDIKFLYNNLLCVTANLKLDFRLLDFKVRV